MTKTIRTRFAPSPTGSLHIGGARTALFNWLFAKHHKGEFLLRIEDTDRARSTDENTQIILDSMEWLGLDYNGEAISQFANATRHREIAEELVKKGKAYYCYCSAEELQAMRAEAEAKGTAFKYPHIWRDKAPTDAPEGVKPVIRLKLPLDGEIKVHDEVQGDVAINASELDDFIILRSDGSPTYLLSVVVDDHDMGITHVIRGDDHMTNTFKQKIIYEAMGWDTPAFAHIPLIHGPDGKKMSKRHGATGVSDYVAMGILPEAMRNYLLRLGWGHGDEEILNDERAIELFDLDGIGRSPSRFDIEKLRSFNAHYIKERDNESLMQLLLPILSEKTHVSDQARIWILKGMDDLKERAKDLHELAEAATIYTKASPITPDEKASEYVTGEHVETLKLLKEKLSGLDNFEKEDISAACKSVSETHDIKMKNVMMPLRAAVLGQLQSPDLAKVVEIIGKDEVIKRLDAAI